jgi:hypothetical protein
MHFGSERNQKNYKSIFPFSLMILMGLGLITSSGINTRISSQLGLWHLFFISLCRTLRDG